VTDSQDATGSDVVSLPKEFFETERDKFYNDWVGAFPREFVQNSVDAKATELFIDIVSADGKGSFGGAPGLDRVTRVTFEDDGTGMSREILDKVFFALGQSTKRSDDGAVGGFGRARIMQAFSQVRYSIVTRDRYVEGDGPRYVNLGIDEARERLFAWTRKMREEARAAGERGDAEAAARLHKAADGHMADADMLRARPSTRKGCRFEVDLNPAHGTSHDKRPTPERMEKAFRDYFALSDIRCEVTINGAPLPQPRRKLEGRKRIAATMAESEVPDSFRKAGVTILDRSDGRKDVVFAKLHSIPETAMQPGERGRMNVRVKGASMYLTSANSSNHALVLEIDPKAAREVLTSNRDGLRQPYRDAVEEFTRMMATDANKALEDRDDETFEVLQGGLGRRMSPRRRPPAEAYAEEAGAVAELPAAPTSHLQALEERARTSRRRSYYSTYSWDDVTREGLEGVPFPVLREFLGAIAKAGSAGETLLAGFGDRARAEGFRETLQRQGENSALEYANGDLLGYLLDQVRYRSALADEKAAQAYKDKLGNLHDVPILRKDMAPPADRYDEAERKSRRTALARAASRCDPRKWDRPSGKGKAPHMLLTAWQVTVDMALELLHEAHPEIEPFPYSVGWTFSHQRWDSIPNRRAYGWINTEAKFVKPDPSQPDCHILLNPLSNEDFSLAYDIRKSESLSKMWAEALHEVSHVVDLRHTEGFAMTLTQLMVRTTPELRKEHERRVREACKAVAQLYGGGLAKVQPLDDEPGPRPAERLLAGLGSAPARPGGRGRVHDIDAAHAADAEMLDARIDREPPEGWRMGA